MKLGVNIDHVATVRQARCAKDNEPNLVRAAVLAEMAGADGITIHLREDRRHIQDADVYTLRDVVTTSLNLEMATASDVMAVALEIIPDMVTLVPEKRQELTTEGGLNILDENVKKNTEDAIKQLKAKGIVVSLFVDPIKEVMDLSKAMGADYVEIHTGKYADAQTEDERLAELEEIKKAVAYAHDLGLKVNAGHGLNYKNVQDIAKIPNLVELNIGHSIISRSIFTGIKEAVKDMKDLMINA